jgi:hypothetical protein
MYKFLYWLYLRSPGWAATKRLRKRVQCHEVGCYQKPLNLHHKSYDWHNAHPVLRYLIPNLIDPMETLCRRHHRKAHGK